MPFNLSEQHSIANVFLSDLRDAKRQQDRPRFRKNLERLGEILAYEISKTLAYETSTVTTPLGEARLSLPTNKVVLATVLRAGLPLHQGLLNYFDAADNAFISAYRKHHRDGTFEIAVEYISCPNLTDTTVILADPMIATGSSIVLAIRELLRHGQPDAVHVVAAVATGQGIDYVRRNYPDVAFWVGAIDEELTAKSYIVPGLGDAGDLSYGSKLQD